MLRFAAAATFLLAIAFAIAAGGPGQASWDFERGAVNGWAFCGLDPLTFMALAGGEGTVSATIGDKTGLQGEILLGDGQVRAEFETLTSDQPSLYLVLFMPPKTGGDAVRLPFHLAWGMTIQEAVLAVRHGAPVETTNGQVLTVRPPGSRVVDRAHFDGQGRLDGFALSCLR